jgi:hypothetical protein
MHQVTMPLKILKSTIIIIIKKYVLLSFFILLQKKNNILSKYIREREREIVKTISYMRSSL